MIVAIDGTNWIHALWHTVGPRAPQLAADRLRAVGDFFCDKLACSETPTQTLHVVSCWDRRSFRHDLQADYKAGRKPKPDGLIAALQEGPEALSREALSLAIDGCEADDLLASLAVAAIKTKQQAVLCSSDKDLYQCPGWGPVAATAALQKCESIERMLDLLSPGPHHNPWKLPGGNGKKMPMKHRNLLGWRDQYPITRQMIELRTDVSEVWDALR